MKTRTGNFPIGFRRGWTDWQKNDLKALADWGVKAGFEVIDLGKVGSEEMATLKAAGIRLGTADLIDFGGLLAKDAGKRKENIAKSVQYVKEASAAGAKVFFGVVIPGDPTAKRVDNYKIAVESYAPICEAAAGAGATIAFEGWPGQGPWYASLLCSPESVRQFLKDVPKGVSLNYDPSHLIRLGIDHLRFLREFLTHVRHVHAKDTALYPEAQYELGLYQDSIIATPHGFGDHVWRYTVPGQGVAHWAEIMKILAGAGYQGAVSVELEDENFNINPEGEKAGLIHSLNYLRGV
jgi:sugar phosphate isomerase/epimerase